MGVVDVVDAPNFLPERPENPNEGDAVHDMEADRIFMYDGEQWVPMAIADSPVVVEDAPVVDTQAPLRYFMWEDRATPLGKPYPVASTFDGFLFFGGLLALAVFHPVLLNEAITSPVMAQLLCTVGGLWIVALVRLIYRRHRRFGIRATAGISNAGVLAGGVWELLSLVPHALNWIPSVSTSPTILEGTVSSFCMGGAVLLAAAFSRFWIDPKLAALEMAEYAERSRRAADRRAERRNRNDDMFLGVDWAESVDRGALMATEIMQRDMAASMRVPGEMFEERRDSTGSSGLTRSMIRDAAEISRQTAMSNQQAMQQMQQMVQAGLLTAEQARSLVIGDFEEARPPMNPDGRNRTAATQVEAPKLPKRRRRRKVILEDD